MKASKRFLAVLLAALQLGLSFSGGAYEAMAAQVVTRVRVQTSVPGGYAGGVLNQPALLNTSLAPLSGVTLSLSPQLSLQAGPQVGAVPTVLPAGVLLQPQAQTPGLLSRPVTPALQAQEQAPQAPALASPEVADALKSEGFKANAPAESSKGASETLFAALHHDRLISGAQRQDPVVQASDLHQSRGRLLPFQHAPAPALKPDVPAPQNAPAQASKLAALWAKPAVKVAAGALTVGAVVAAFPFLAAHAAAVAAIGSITLSVIGIPQIISNFKGGKEGVKDLAIGSPLIWFSAAVLLSAVSIGNGSSLWWNAANLAGVAESAIVLGQLNYLKRDPKALKATLLTVAATLLPLPFLGTTAAFTAAMGLLWVLNWPQLRQNYRLFKQEGRAPKGIAPAYPALVGAGSLLHLFAAILGGDARWAMNASIAILTAGLVLGQIYLPKAANGLVGPLVRVTDKVQAKVAAARLFSGSKHKTYKGEAPQERMAEMLEKAKALPGRSVIYLEAPTAAGKSTLAGSLKNTLGSRIKVFPVDNYFKAEADVPRGKDGRPDFDQPGALDLERAERDIKALLAGQKVELPLHDMKTGTNRYDSGVFLSLADDEVLIVDSIYASHPSLLRAAEGRSTLNVFLYAPAIVRLARRLLRDRKERGISPENNLKSWGTILEDERQYILPLREKADVFVNLVTAEELEKLQSVYEGLMAEDYALAELFKGAIKASLEADERTARR